MSKGYVYEFLNDDGEVIYVGSTHDITSRIKQHFRTKNNGKMGAKEYDEVDSIRYTIVGSRPEAYILETYLINKLSPKYNTRLADDADIRIVNVDHDTIEWHLFRSLDNTDGRKRSFYQYIKSNRANLDGPGSDLLYDMERDKSFPKKESRRWKLRRYLDQCHACDLAIITFDYWWFEYAHECGIETDWMDCGFHLDKVIDDLEEMDDGSLDDLRDAIDELKEIADDLRGAL